MKLLLSWFTAILLTQGIAHAGEFTIVNLKVQGKAEPLAIEDRRPLFSWQMRSQETGQYQVAYRIVVMREFDGAVVWDSGRVGDGRSVNIKYLGAGLQPETGYGWHLTVWDGDGESRTATSRFETGIMDPRQAAWEGARWIGSRRLSLDAASHNYFRLSTGFRIDRGEVMSFLIGADDFRLKNVMYNADNLAGENYLRIELDLSGAGTERGASLNLYRPGYTREDRADTPFISVNRAAFPQTNIDEIFTAGNKNSDHYLELYVDMNNLQFVFDGTELITVPRDGDSHSGFSVGNVTGPTTGASRIQAGPLGYSQDFNTFPHLASIGFAATPGTKVIFSDYTIRNSGQSEDNVVFDPGHYSIFDGLEGVTVSGNEIRVENGGDKTVVGYADPSYGAVTMLRTDFDTDSGRAVAKAKVYVSSMGACQLFVNGSRVGSDWFTPGSSQFRNMLGYHAYDVTDLIENGANCMGAILSPGWWTGPMTFSASNFNFYGDYEALLVKLVIEYRDGSTRTVVTDPRTWTAFRDGPIRYGTFFHGERYDASKEEAVSGWSRAGYHANGWEKAGEIAVRDWIDLNLKARHDIAVHEAERLTARRVMPVHSRDRRTWIYDMGVNMVGVPSVTFPGGWLQKDDTVIIRYAEELYPGFRGDDDYYVKTYGRRGRDIAGRMFYESYRAALATDFYIAASDGPAVYMPTTTYRGYRYIQITLPSHAGPLPLENIEGVVLTSDEGQTGTYHAVTADGETGELANRLFSNIQRSQIGNFFTIPTDCPQRNERMGWTGDAQAYVRTGTYNSDSRNFFRQWMAALRDDQGVGGREPTPHSWPAVAAVPGGIGSTVPTYNREGDPSFADGTTWAAAVCMVPWQLYLQYGDLQIVEENIETMMDWLTGMAFYRFSDRYPNLSSKTTGLADWLSLDPNTPSDLVNNAIYIYMMEATAVMADAVGRDDYASVLRERLQKALQEWNDLYVDPATGMTRNKEGGTVHSQSSYAVPIAFNIFNEDNLPAASAYLAQLARDPSASGDGSISFPPYSITTGFAGTPNILPALSSTGNNETAYRMFSCTDLASWLYPVKMGATSVWERWNGYEAAFGPDPQNNMNSFNHFALGAVGQWMYEYQLGITTDRENPEDGYKHFILQPQAGPGFLSLSGSYDSDYGTIRSGWTADGSGNLVSYKATVPANTTATLYLPSEDTLFPVGDIPGYRGTAVRNGIECAVIELRAGEYLFE